MRSSKKLRKELTIDEIKTLSRYYAAKSRESFNYYRHYINKFTLKTNWFVKEVNKAIQEFYEDYKKGLKPVLIINTPPQHGKLLADCTNVLTTKGWVKHGDLKIGDFVYGLNGKPIKVTNVFNKDVADIRVEFTNKEVIYCHKNHEWTLYNRNSKKFETIETNKLLNKNKLYCGVIGKRGSRYTYQLPKHDIIDSYDIELPLQPYVMGAWLGDGTQTKPCITIDNKDIDIIENVVKNGFTIKNKHFGYNNVVSYNFGKELKDKLKDCNVFSNECGIRKKHIPSIYLVASIKQRLELLAGLIDTDGYYHSKNGRFVFTTSDLELANSFCSLLSTFACKYSFVTKQPKISSSGITGKKEYYVIGFTPNFKIPCVLKRKQNELKKPVVQRSIAIKSVTYDNKGYVGNCITVDAKDGLYLVGNSLIPTHNSTTIIEASTWLAGKDPNLRFIYASFSQNLGRVANSKFQRIINSYEFKNTFPNFISENKLRTYQKNKEKIEFVGYNGYFRNTTVGGPITGETLDIGIIDDPLKGWVESNSKLVRERTKSWYVADFRTRFAENAGMIFIMTRWHVDDLLSYIISKNYSNVKHLIYPAIAEKDEQHRNKGEPLFPELKSLDFLLERKQENIKAIWQSLYQQNPIVDGGMLFKEEWFKYYEQLPNISYRIIFADTAQKTKDMHDYSVFQCWGFDEIGRIYLLDQIRGKWESPELIKRAVAFWSKHATIERMGTLRSMNIEDKSSGTALIQMLRRDYNIPIVAIPRSVDKVLRAKDTLPFLEAGNVFLPKDAPYISDYLDEFITFPNGKNDDQIDPTMDAIINSLSNKVTTFGRLL